MKKINFLIAMLLATLSAFSTPLVSGVYCIGPSASYTPPIGSPYSYVNAVTPYPTIDSALKNLNTLGAAGDIIFELQNDYASTLEPISINCSYQGTASATLTLKVRNDLVTPLLISKTSASTNGIGMIEFNNAKYVTIDTRINNDCNSYGLRIVNNQSNSNLAFTLGSTCINLKNDSKHITLSGVQFEIADIAIRFDNNNTITGAGNDSINIICNLFKVRNNLLNTNCAPHGIWFSHNQIINPLATSNDINIQNNKFENVMRGIYLLEGVSGNYSISNNHFYRNINNTPGPVTGEFILNVKPINLTIDGNYFGGSLPFCGGAKMNIGSTPNLLLLGATTGGLIPSSTKSVLSNNRFENLERTTNAGLYCVRMDGHCVWDITGNTFGNPNVANDISLLPSNQFYGIYYSVSTHPNTGALVSNIHNNSFNNITSTLINNTGSFQAIRVANTPFSIKNNVFKNIIHGGDCYMIFTHLGNAVLGHQNEFMYNTAENIVQSNTITSNYSGIFRIENQGNPLKCTSNRIGSLNNSHDIVFNGTIIQPFYIQSPNDNVIVDSNTICNVEMNNAQANYSQTMLSIYAKSITSCGYNSLYNIDSKSKLVISETSATSNPTSLVGLSITNLGSNSITNSNLHHNKIYNVTNSNTDLQTGGLGVCGLGIFGGATNINYSISENEIYGLSNHAISSGTNPYVMGLAFSSPRNAIIYNNRISISNSTFNNAVNLYGFKRGSTSQAFSFYHNSIAISGLSSAGTTSFCLYKNVNTSTHDTMKNNIFYSSRTGAGTNFCIGYEHSILPYWGISDYNTFFVIDTNLLGKWLNTLMPLSVWRTTSNTEVNSFIKNVKFMDINNDLHLNPYTNCALNGAGIYIPSISMDMDGDTRNNPPDIGADEVSYIIPTVTVSHSNPVCPGQLINLLSTPSTPIVPLSYSWFGPNTFNSIVQNPSIPNVQAINQGNYSVTVTDAYDCSASGFAAVVLQNNTGSGTDTACNAYIWEGITYNASGAYTHTYTNVAGCDSVHTLILTINNSNAGSSDVTACNAYIWEGTTYNASGAYTHTYTNLAGCDSVHTLNLSINYSNTGSSAVTACDSYLWEGTTYTASGVYTHTYTNVAGCDSLHTLNLSINYSNTGSSAVTACNDYLWEGNTYTASGAYTHTYTNVAGCDSVHTLNLTINYSNTGSSAVTACDSYLWEGNTYTASGAYTHTYTNVAGCDSVHTLNLTINYSNTGSSAVTACDSYLWEGNTYTTSGAYTHTYTNVAGCDSVHTLNLTINYSNTGSSAVTACDSYLWEGNTYTASGAYTHTYTNVAGCDSVHTLNLTINYSNTGSSAVTACNAYIWEGNTYTASGAYTHTYTNVAGCDSVHTLNLTINYSNTGSSAVTACDSYLWEGNTYTASGAYTHTYTNVAGCDSVHTLILTSNNSNTGSSAVTACNVYIWEGTTYTASGAYTHTYTNVAGCDSVHTLNLTINYSNTGSSAVTACDSYLWEGTTYTTSGAYTHTYTNVAGCDSVHTLNLTINYSNTGSSAVTACDSYLWEGITYTTSGAYTHTYTNIAGCDSVHSLNLTINSASNPGTVSITANAPITLPYGQLVNTSGNYLHTYTNISGCDSIVTYLIVINNNNNLIAFTYCPSNINLPCVNGNGTIATWQTPTAGIIGTNCIGGDEIPGFTYMGNFGGHAYYKSTANTYNWISAQNAATAAGGYLVSINNAQENNFVKGLISNGQNGSSEAWIGLNDIANENNFEWSNGDPVIYTKWNGNEPNNTDAGNNCNNNQADYVSMRKNNGKWQDRSICETNEFIMEIDCLNPVTVVKIAGPNSGSFFNGNTTTTITYLAYTNSGDSAYCTFNVIVDTCNPEYCPPIISSTEYEHINRVQFGTIDNTSGNNNGYGDYSLINTTMSKGSTYQIQLTPGFANCAYTEYWKVYIDYNNDGDWNDAGETATHGHGNGIVVKNITIPVNAVTGVPLRMRVVMKWGSYTDGPCPVGGCNAGTIWGETEDYSIFVIDGCNKTTSAGIETIDLNENNFSNNNIEIVSLYPNPVSENAGVLYLKYRSAMDGQVNIGVYDIKGSLISIQTMKVFSGENRCAVSLNKLKKGVFLLHLSNQFGKIINKFIVE